MPASSSKSSDSLFASLNASGLPDTPDAHHFVNELFSKVPRKKRHKSLSDSSRKQAEKETMALRSQKFELLLEEEDGDIVPLKKEKRKGKEKEKEGEKEKREKHIRKREYDAKEWEDGDEEVSRKRWKGDEEADDQSSKEDIELDLPEDEEVRRERERLDDLRDRDAFADRVRERDREKMKKLVEDRSSKGAAAEAAQRRQLADDVGARDVALPSLRLHSRQEYLTKREIQQIELLRREIADDQALFAGMKISKREKMDLERKKELLKLVEERLKINDKWEGYQLPEDYLTEQGKIDKKKKENALYKRYEDAKPKDDQFVTDIDQWEAHQTQHSTFKTGAMDKREIIDDYEYVFDESQTIKFVLEASLPGTGMSAADKLLQTRIDEAEQRGKSVVLGWVSTIVKDLLQQKPLRRLGRIYLYTLIRNNSFKPSRIIKF